MLYNPTAEPQRTAYVALVSAITRLVPSCTTEGELYEAIDFVIGTIREATKNGGGESAFVQGKSAIEEYFGSILSRKEIVEFITNVRSLSDFVVGVSNSGATANSAAAANPQMAPILEMESSSSSEDDDDDSSSSSSGSSSDDDDDEGAAVKRRRTEGGIDSTLSAGDMSAALGLDADGDGTAEGTRRIQLSDVKPNAIRDVTLKYLFPADSEAERTAKANKILAFLGNEGEEDQTVQSQLTGYLQRFANAQNSGGGLLAGSAGLDMTDTIEQEVDYLVANRWVLVYGTQIAAAVAAATASASAADPLQQQTAASAARHAVLERVKQHAMRNRAVADIYKEATGVSVSSLRGAGAGAGSAAGGAEAGRPLEVLDLVGLHRQGEKAFFEASATRPKIKIPKGTRHGEYETHEEFVLPQTGTYAQSGKKGKRQVTELKIQETFPKWAVAGFDIAKTKALNPVQSRVFPIAFGADDNMLVCAPTGAGKTLVALMTILRVLDKYKTDSFGSDFHKDDFKIVYIAPMKALVQEVVQTFSARLEPFGVTVAELSGDSGLSQQQLAQTQMIVATPEKWDIVTRKSAELSVANFVRLIIIDEIHLLHNDRGPILESIVSRMILQQQRTQTHCRLVGLSATLPNAKDVSRFMKVDATRGFFEFDAADRPVPLQQSFCAVRKLPNKREADVLNMVTYTKTMQFEGQSVMVFVHSRKDTEYTAKYLMERAVKENQMGRLGVDVAGNRRVVEEAGAELREALKDLIPNGFGVHHAGMSAFERKTVEELFLHRRIKVLVCTSTLAWGVNLPAHAVIIKGTQIFSPQHKGMTYLSTLDVLQMFGRAGRKGFDTFGEACIITTLNDVYYYLSILTQQLPIESQFVNHVVNALNAEVVLGNVLSIADGAAWLQHTYHYVRSQACPKQYGTEVTRRDPELLHFRENLVHSAALTLAECGMVQYDEDARTLRSTPLGRIASTYYIHHDSMALYNSLLKATSQEPDLFYIFSKSSEFKQISVRREEYEEIKRLVDLCPVPVKEAGTRDPTPSAKINVLLQCYITGANMKGMALMTEMVYIRDSAQRILRAMYDMCVERDFGATSRKVYEIYQSVLRHQWAAQCPLRQLMPDVRNATQTHGTNPLLVRAEVRALRECYEYAENRKNFFYEHYRNYSRDTFIQHVFREGAEEQAAVFYSWLRKLPRLLVRTRSVPVSNTVLRVDISVTIDVAYDPIVHDGPSAELILSVEDSTLSSATFLARGGGNKSAPLTGGPRKNILFHEVVDVSKYIKKGAAAQHGAAHASADGDDAADAAEEDGDDEPSAFETTVLVPVSADTRPSHYYCHAMLGSWVGSAVTIPIPLTALAMPPAPPAPTPLEAFAKKMRAEQEERRRIRLEARRLRVAASGGDEGAVFDDGDNDNEEEDLFDATGAVSIARVVGDDLAGAAAELFPFTTVSAAQAAAGEAIMGGEGAASWGGNVYVGMPAGTGKTFLAELAILRLLKENALGEGGGEGEEGAGDLHLYKHLLYLTATPAQAARRYAEFAEKYGTALEQTVILLSGNTLKDVRAIRDALARNEAALRANNNNSSAGGEEGQPQPQQQQRTIVLVSCAANAAALVQRGAAVLDGVRYLILDHLHQLGTEAGGVYEAVVSRLLSKPYLLNGGAAPRVLGLSYPVVYPQAIGEWLKAKAVGKTLFSFDNKAMRRLQVSVEGSLVPGARSRSEFQRLAALKELTTQPRYEEGPTAVFAPTAQDAVRLARQLIDLRRRLNMKLDPATGARTQQQQATENDDVTNNNNNNSVSGDTAVNAVRVVGGVAGALSPSDALIATVQNETLRAMLSRSRVGFLTSTLSAEDAAALFKLVSLAALPVVVFTSRDDAWRIPAALFRNGLVIASERLPLSAIIAEADASSSSSSSLAQQAFDCTAVEMVQMTSRVDRHCVVYCREPRRWYWESLLCAAALMPVASVLSTPDDYEGSFNSRIAEGSVATLSQCLSVFQSHYFYHILKVNPAFYGFPSAERDVLRERLSAMCEATCARLKEAGCVLYSEAEGTVSPTSIGKAAASLCVSVDTVRTLMAVATAQLEAEIANDPLAATAESVNGTCTASRVAAPTDSIVREMVRLLCNLDEITRLPCAALNAASERRLLKRIAQDLAVLAPIRTEISFAGAGDSATAAADKALVLVAMLMARTEYDLMGMLPLYKARGPSSGGGGQNQPLLPDAADEEDVVVARQLLRDAEEIITRAEHLALAAVDIVGRQSYGTARCLMDVYACVSVRSFPSTIAATRQLSQIPEAVLPGALLASWAGFATSTAPNSSSPHSPLTLADAVAAARPSSTLPAVVGKALLTATGHALDMSDEAIAARRRVAAGAAEAVSASASVLAKVLGCCAVEGGQARIPKRFTAERVGLTAKAGIVEEHEVLHLRVSVSLNNFMLGGDEDEKEEEGEGGANKLNNNNNGLVLWAACFDANDLTKPLMGLHPIRIPTTSASRHAGKGMASGDAERVEAAMIMPLPEDTDEANEVALKVVLVPQTILLTGPEGGVVADVEMDEGEEEEEQ